MSTEPTPKDAAEQIRHELQIGGSAQHAAGVQWFFKEEIQSHGWYTAALRKAAVQRVADELAQMDAAYGAPMARRFLAVDEVSVPGAQRLPLNALAEWAQTAVTQARTEV